MQIQHKTDTGTNCTVANFHLLSNQAEKAAFTNTKIFGLGCRLVLWFYMQDTFMYKPTSPRLFSYNLIIHNFEWHVEWQIGLELDFCPGFLFVESVLPLANKMKLSIPPQ